MHRRKHKDEEWSFGLLLRALAGHDQHPSQRLLEAFRCSHTVAIASWELTNVPCDRLILPEGVCDDLGISAVLCSTQYGAAVPHGTWLMGFPLGFGRLGERMGKAAKGAHRRQHAVRVVESGSACCPTSKTGSVLL